MCRREKATMESNQSLLHFFLFFLLVGFASSSHLSNGIFEPHKSISRSLLQQKSTCSVDFENMNYTVITSQCKGPHYTVERCCPPLKELLCPVSKEINDLKSDCADTFFSYANLYGKYPPGLFAALCKEGQTGLDCSKYAGAPKSGASSASYSSLVMILAAVVVMIFYI